MLYGHKGLSYRGKNDSSGRHGNDSTGLEVKILAQPLCAPYVFGSTGKEGIMMLAGVIDPDYHGETGLLLHRRKEKYV